MSNNNYFYLYDIVSKKYINFIDSENRFIPTGEMITKFSFVNDYDASTNDQYFIYLYPDVTLLYDNNYNLYVTKEKNKSIDFKIIKNNDNTVSIYDKNGKYFIRIYTPEPEMNPQYKEYVMDNIGSPTRFFLKYPKGPDYKPPTPDSELKYSCGILGCKNDKNGKFDTIDECSKNCHSLLYLSIGILVLVLLTFVIIYFLGKNHKHKKHQISY